MTATDIDPEILVPRYRRGVKLRFDEVRGTFVLLAPEKVFVPDEIAAEILQLIDGERKLTTIAAQLAEKFGAPIDVVTKDILIILTDLAARGAIEF